MRGGGRGGRRGGARRRATSRGDPGAGASCSLGDSLGVSIWNDATWNGRRQPCAPTESRSNSSEATNPCSCQDADSSSSTGSATATGWLAHSTFSVWRLTDVTAGRSRCPCERGLACCAQDSCRGRRKQTLQCGARCTVWPAWRLAWPLGRAVRPISMQGPVARDGYCAAWLCLSPRVGVA